MRISVRIAMLLVVVGLSAWPLLSMAEPGEKPCHHNLGESGEHQHDGEHHDKEPCDSEKGKAHSGEEPCDSKKEEHQGKEPCDSEKGQAHSDEEPCDSKKEEHYGDKPCDKKEQASSSPADEVATSPDDKPLE